MGALRPPLRWRLRGEVDLLTAGKVESAIKTEIVAAPPALIDMTGLSFLDSAGLAMLAREHMMAGWQMAFRVAVTHRGVIAPIRLTAMDRLLTMFYTVAHGVAMPGSGRMPAFPNG